MESPYYEMTNDFEEENSIAERNFRSGYLKGYHDAIIKTQEQIVRCKDCKHGQYEDGTTESALTRLFTVMDMAFTNRIGSVLTGGNAMKIKDKLIHILGGYTKSEYQLNKKHERSDSCDSARETYSDI